MLRRGDARETSDDLGGEKVNLGSKVTPRIRGSILLRVDWDKKRFTIYEAATYNE